MSNKLVENEECDILLHEIYLMLNSPSYDNPNLKTLKKVLHVLRHADAYPDHVQLDEYDNTCHCVENR